jgi:tetratricopeptide (TPR) repeat protein
MRARGSWSGVVRKQSVIGTSNTMAALKTAVSLGPERAETYSNLTVVYERESRLDEALHEIITSLVLAPEDADAVNANAIICAKIGNLVFARNIWTQLTQAARDCAPARTNLALLDQSCGGSCGSYAHSQSGYYNHNFGSDEWCFALIAFCMAMHGPWSTCGTLPILHSIIENDGARCGRHEIQIAARHIVKLFFTTCSWELANE